MSPRKQHPGDPTAERTADQSTQTAGGLGGGRDRAERNSGSEPSSEDLFNRNRGERYDTPRRYEEESNEP